MRVKPLAQSEISSRTKRSKGTENTPPWLLLRLCIGGGGEGGRDESGVAIADGEEEDGARQKGGKGQSEEEGDKRESRTHVRRVWWPLASVQYSLESHSIPRAQTRKSR